MKRIKNLFILGILSISLGIGCFSFSNNFDYQASAETNQTINSITACKRFYGDNASKTFIRFACNDVVGSYQTTYSGTVYDSAGKPLPLDLYQNGGVGTADWVNGGSRLFEFKTDSDAFINAIGNGSTFIINSDSVFTNGDASISFSKSYEFTNIYDGNFKYQEIVKSEVSFSIAEVETRLSGTRFRVGVNNMVGLSAGFSDIFIGNVFDVDNKAIKATITDGAVGSTASGNRRVYIDLEEEAKNNIFIIKDTENFVNSSGMKTLKFATTYKIEDKTLYYCDGDSHHIYDGEVDDGEHINQTCIVCGHSTSVDIYQVKLGSSDKYCQASAGETQTEISIKIGGCSGYNTSDIPNVFRGNAKLNDADTAIKIMINDNIVRLYIYLSNDHTAVEKGVVSISNAMRFKSDDNQLLRFVDSVNIKYNTSTFKYRIDPITYSYKESVISDVITKNWVSVNDKEVVISYVDVKLSNGFECLDKSSTYRGKVKVDGKENYIPLTLQKVGGKNKLAFIFNGNPIGLLEVSKNVEFLLDTLGTSFESETNAPDSIKFDKDLSFEYDATYNLVNAKNTTLSLSGVGAWSQSLDSLNYNSMCSFDDCSIVGISEDNSEIHPETLTHRGYHFYGKGYNKDNDNDLVDVDIWISSFKNTDTVLNSAIVKTAIYVNLVGASSNVGIKLQKDDLFICSAYNLTLRLDDDYLVKWYVNSSRTTAGKYNNDKVGPTINVDLNNIPTFIEGDKKPTLPVSVNDDVDDVVSKRAQIWEDGALDNNNCLIKGKWTVTLTAIDSSGNEAIPVQVTIIVNEKPEPIDINEEETEKVGCQGDISISFVIVGFIPFLSLLFIHKKKTSN